MPDKMQSLHPLHCMKMGRCLSFLIVLLLALLLFPLHASAHTTVVDNGGPSMSINAGFNGRYRDGNWIPMQVTLTNNGPDFTGDVAVSLPAPFSGSDAPATTYKAEVSLATGAQKQISLMLPLTLGTYGTTQNLTVRLLDSNGHTVSSQITTLRSLGMNDIFIGILSDQATGFGPLNAVSLPNQTASLVVEPLNATTFPTTTSVLKNFDLLILDDFTTGTLSPDQLTALQGWVNQGGTLLLVGGPEWRRTLSPLPSALLPVTISGTQTLTSPVSLLPIGSPGNGGAYEQNVSTTVAPPLTVSTATLNANSTAELSVGQMPLLAESQLGKGLLCYLAFDPTLDPVVNWPHATLLWQGLLLRTLGDQLLPQTTGSPIPFRPLVATHPYDMSGLVQSFLPNTFPSVSLILAILLGYILVLGPIRYLIVRRLKRRDWSWRIVLIAIVFFSLLSYGIALQQKGTSVVSDTISLLQLERMQGNTTLAHEETYVGVFVPGQGDFHVHMSGNSLVQPANNQFDPTTQSQNTAITAMPNGTDVELQGVNIWTLHSVKAERDRTLQGGIISHLTLQNGTLTGAVMNTLPYALSNVYVLMESNYLSLGELSPGQTQQVKLRLNANIIITPTNQSLAEQIATSNGVSTNYSGYYDQQQPESELQKRMSMLSTLSGEGPYYCGGGSFCYGPAYKVATSNGIIISSSGGGGGSPTVNRQDPLLIPNAAATLIGWSDTPSAAISDVTINGEEPTGTQEVMLQAPLDVSFAGNVSLPASFINGQIIDVQNQGTNIQEQLPGIYTMTTGSVTFELTIPHNPQLHVNTATIAEPSDLNQALQATGSQPNALNDISVAQVYLYNWQTGHWDATTANNATITLSNTNAYIGAEGRILIQIVNQNTSKGTIAFSTPSVQIQGNT
jgi:uncharacterized membrane protein YhaH (DUF805 family)